MMSSGPQYKVILLGDPGVGKTTFFLRLRDSSFVDTESRPSVSIGVDDLEYKHSIGDTDITVSVSSQSQYLFLKDAPQCSATFMILEEAKGLGL